MRFLLIYASIDGQTKKIAERIMATIQAGKHDCQMVSIEHAPQKMEAVDCLVIGSRIRFGHHDKAGAAFVQAHLDWLNQHPSAFYSVSLVARKKEKSTPATNSYCRKFFSKTHWQPKNAAVFAGKLDYSLYNFWQKRIIRFIMWMTDGPTDFSSKIEYTDWEKVDEFANKLIN
jgi:menaquinone-dependent protoporphyrinogen oxidase